MSKHTLLCFQQNLFYLSLLHRKWWIRVYRKVPFILTKYTYERTENGHKFISLGKAPSQHAAPGWSGLVALLCVATEGLTGSDSVKSSSAPAGLERLGRIAIRNGMLMCSSVQGRLRGQRSALPGTALIHIVALTWHRKTKTLRKTAISNTVSKNWPVIK